MNSEQKSIDQWSALLCLMAFVGLLPLPLVADESAGLYMEARLIWATNGEKPKDADLKDIPPEFTKKFRSVFTWENYYQVKVHKKSFELGKVQKLKMSDKCRIDILFKDKEEVEIQLYGENKPLAKRKQKVVMGELIVMGGDCKGSDTAWFVVFKPISKKDFLKKED